MSRRRLDLTAGARRAAASALGHQREGCGGGGCEAEGRHGQGAQQPQGLEGLFRCGLRDLRSGWQQVGHRGGG